MSALRRLLVANRGEIAIRVFRTAHELGIQTVAIYSHEDRFALHRFKADEAYEIGRPGEPIRSYLDVDALVELAQRYEIDAIHPGYGFLSENPKLARACESAGIVFVGPKAEVLEQMGDKVAARMLADSVGVPVLAGSAEPLADAASAAKLAKSLGYPVILKAAHGGGGRGMRVVRDPADLADALEQAQRESQTAFGSSEVFLEKFIERPRHLEVQLLGDRHGNLVHLFERDCSVQRRHQKVVEIAPAVRLDAGVRRELLEAALAIGRGVGYENAGTVEFLLDVATGKHYFIEVNPRIQVEHTVTEVVTGFDLVRAQILVAGGTRLDDPRLGMTQDAISTRGYALQCRVTTEDPENDFLPDYGRITAYRSPGGTGVRLDGGTAFAGAVVTPYYDSLLVKITCSDATFDGAARRMERCLQEFRIRGVKTNIPFLINVVTHPQFVEGGFTTRFIDETAELWHFPTRRDRATKLCRYLAERAVNGPVVESRGTPPRRRPARLPVFDRSQPLPSGTRDLLRERGPAGLAQWARESQTLLLTDTTMRDAHQSLLATRLRSYDMLAVAEAYARLTPQLFSLEMWGGATFDTSLRFLKECPWRRLADLRERIPNILFQMLLRASNAVGYAGYPDNVVREFVHEAAQAGIDVFRVFDSLNWLPNFEVAMEAVIEAGAVCEAAICYTGDLLDPSRPKYDLKYYVELAKELESRGAHILAIKDMAGLCKPAAARKLVHTLREEVGLPIHFHTHDTAGVQAAAILEAADVGLDIADGAMAPLSGMTSQPNLNSLIECLRFTPRASDVSREGLAELATYWEAVREFYAPFEAGQLASTAEVYRHEMPGGQSTNLLQQAKALGLGDRWPEICRLYADCNQLLGDIVKVTPSSKAVGDLALFLLTNDLQPADILSTSRELAFPESVIDLLSGRMGQPPGGFPPRVIEAVLRGQARIEGRPGASLPPANLTAAAEETRAALGREPGQGEVLSYLMFPRVVADFATHEAAYSDTSVLPTPQFLFGLEPGEEAEVEIERGKTLFIKLLAVGDPHDDGQRTVFFEVNGQPRSVTVVDRALEPETPARVKADASDPAQVAAPMPGVVVSVSVQVGDSVAKGQTLLALEAMKMETTLYAERPGRVAELHAKPGTQVATGDLLVRLDS